MPIITSAPRPRLERMASWFSETGFVGNRVGVERGTFVGVGEAARRNGVGIRTVTDSGVDTPRVGSSVGVTGSVSF